MAKSGGKEMNAVYNNLQRSHKKKISNPTKICTKYINYNINGTQTEIQPYSWLKKYKSVFSVIKLAKINILSYFFLEEGFNIEVMGNLALPKI